MTQTCCPAVSWSTWATAAGSSWAAPGTACCTPRTSATSPASTCASVSVPRVAGVSLSPPRMSLGFPRALGPLWVSLSRDSPQGRCPPCPQGCPPSSWVSPCCHFVPSMSLVSHTSLGGGSCMARSSSVSPCPHPLNHPIPLDLLMSPTPPTDSTAVPTAPIPLSPTPLPVLSPLTSPCPHSQRGAGGAGRGGDAAAAQGRPGLDVGLRPAAPRGASPACPQLRHQVSAHPAVSGQRPWGHSGGRRPP